jgi:hypothetical protein
MKRRDKAEDYKTLHSENLWLLDYANTVDDLLVQYVNRKRKEAKKKRKKKKKERYPRDEALYNLIQETEFDVFIEFLPILAEVALTEVLPPSVSSATFNRYYCVAICLAIKRYFDRSYRRGMGVIRYIVKHSFPNLKIPCFKTLNNYILKPDFVNIIDSVILQSASLLNNIETVFSTDTTGEATIVYSSWYHIRIGRRIHRREHVNVHLTSTTKANMVLCVDTCPGKDGYYLRRHVQITAQIFTIRHWQGDCKYLCRENCNVVYNNGGQAHFRIKDNTTTRPLNSPEWKRMTAAQKKEYPEEIKQLNQRQNVESTISAKKRKCGHSTRAKDEISQSNDTKLGWMVYNFTILSRLVYEFNIAT